MSTSSGAGKKKKVEDEEISSEEEGEGRGRTVGDSDKEEDEFADETAADKRRRLALQYLKNTKAEIGTLYLAIVT